MTEEKHTFDALENIKRWCEALSGAYVPKAINAGMLALLVELECAIEKFQRMRKRFVSNLPENVTAREFESWLNWLCNGMPDPEKLFQTGMLENRIADDVDLARMSMENENVDSIPESFWNRFVSAERLDNVVTGSILKKYEAPFPNDRQWEEDCVAVALNGVGGLHYVIRGWVEDKTELLRYIIREIISQLEFPSDQALKNVLRHYWSQYMADKIKGREHINVEVFRFFCDHQRHRNYGALLKREEDKARTQLQQRLEKWGVDLENLIRTDNPEKALMIDEREAGLVIYRHVSDLHGKPELLKELFACFGLFMEWRMYRKERLRLDNGPRASAPSSSQPPQKEAFEVPAAWKSAFCGQLTSNPAACIKLQETLRAVNPDINKGRGKQSERKNWIHVCHAWRRLKLLKSNCIPQSFAEAVNAVCPKRSVGSITKTFSDKPWEEAHLKDSDRDRIAELVNLFQPVSDLMDHTKPHADSPKR